VLRSRHRYVTCIYIRVHIQTYLHCDLCDHDHPMSEQTTPMAHTAHTDLTTQVHMTWISICISTSSPSSRVSMLSCTESESHCLVVAGARKVCVYPHPSCCTPSEGAWHVHDAVCAHMHVLAALFNCVSAYASAPALSCLQPRTPQRTLLRMMMMMNLRTLLRMMLNTLVPMSAALKPVPPRAAMPSIVPP